MGKIVALTFDFDAMSLWIGSYKATNVSMVSRGEFGVIAASRLLKLLAKYDLRATFFIPGHTALAFPDSVRAIVDGGHEVAHHGFVHEKVTELTPGQEKSVLLRGIEILEALTGKRPIGYRSPSWEFTNDTLALLLAEGFSYDSSLMASDFQPYWPRQGDRFSPDGPYIFGHEVPIVEIPVSWALDDFPHFEFVRGGTQGLKPPSQVYEIWWEEFDYFRREIAEGCFTLCLHPQVIGRGHRIVMLERLIQAMKGSGSTEFSTLEDVARAWKTSQKVIPAENY